MLNIQKEMSEDSGYACRAIFILLSDNFFLFSEIR